MLFSCLCHRSASSLPNFWCENILEFPLLDDGMILWTISCRYSSSQLKSTSEKAKNNLRKWIGTFLTDRWWIWERQKSSLMGWESYTNHTVLLPKWVPHAARFGQKAWEAFHCFMFRLKQDVWVNLGPSGIKWWHKTHISNTMTWLYRTG